MNADLHSMLIGLEKELLTSETRASLARLDELIRDDFIEYGSSGEIFGKDVVLEALPLEKGERKFFADNFKARSLSQNLVQVTFDTVVTDVKTNTSKSAIRSSLWKLEDGRWQMIFHQGTITNS